MDQQSASDLGIRGKGSKTQRYTSAGPNVCLRGMRNSTVIQQMGQEWGLYFASFYLLVLPTIARAGNSLLLALAFLLPRWGWKEHLPCRIVRGLNAPIHVHVRTI